MVLISYFLLTSFSWSLSSLLIFSVWSSPWLRHLPFLSVFSFFKSFFSITFPLINSPFSYLAFTPTSFPLFFCIPVFLLFAVRSLISFSFFPILRFLLPSLSASRTYFRYFLSFPLTGRQSPLFFSSFSLSSFFSLWFCFLSLSLVCFKFSLLSHLPFFSVCRDSFFPSSIHGSGGSNRGGDCVVELIVGTVKGERGGWF